ncbi:MAG TPA: L,D-transpeptidase [Gemmatimonadaceae bacterium]|nr:L,D-transpeptidase [Gemmatimonadaceae bacterium]
MRARRGVAGFFVAGGLSGVALVAALLTVVAATARVVSGTMHARFERDVARMVFNDNLQLLDDVRRRVGLSADSLEAILDAPADSAARRGVIVVSIEEHRLWYRLDDQVVFETRVATGSGKILTHERGSTHWKFETPRGRLVVVGKEANPAWVPPDWHYVEAARNRRLRVTPLLRGQAIDAGDGSAITVSGNNVVRRHADGREEPLEASDGREIVVGDMLIVPPFGTHQRRYHGVLGSHRLLLGDGYALHGTNVPSSIGRSVSHGCVRLRNEDIETLFRIVPVGTPVYIY